MRKKELIAELLELGQETHAKYELTTDRIIYKQFEEIELTEEEQSKLILADYSLDQRMDLIHQLIRITSLLKEDETIEDFCKFFSNRL